MIQKTKLLGVVAAFLFCVAVAGAEVPFKPAKELPVSVKPISIQGIHNVFLLTTNVYSGSSPEGKDAFEALAKLGVRTIVSVDGGKPAVELARKYGMRYVHLPHGYDGINPAVQASLVKAAFESFGPIFIHCHHGKHRGPAAAAVVCLTKEGWTKTEADSWPKTAGTSTNYVGLFDVVKQFQPPTAEQIKALPKELPEVAKVSGLIEAMVEIDARWEHLKAIRAAGYATPKDAPDLVPAKEAIILLEHYRESQRLPESQQKGEDFMALLKRAEEEAGTTHALLKSSGKSLDPQAREKLDRAFHVMGQSCSTCHKKYRDPSGIKKLQ